uniref:Uncharacterized protein n=1 Tax=Candidatus Kentrum sp. DK TaxID=2126562 RepID=A0A450RWB4_9GAMM|nr:MAG: hypothetical protein BECKDK2373C_GA0170839_100517 [Candidatus Kentron sp. DK]
MVSLQYRFHLTDKCYILLWWNTPHTFLPGLYSVFFTIYICLTVSVEIGPTTFISTKRSPKHLQRPARLSFQGTAVRQTYQSRFTFSITCTGTFSAARQAVASVLCLRQYTASRPRLTKPSKLSRSSHDGRATYRFFILFVLQIEELHCYPNLIRWIDYSYPFCFTRILQMNQVVRLVYASLG